MPTRTDLQDIVSGARALGGQLVEDRTFTGEIDSDLALVRRVIAPSADISLVSPLPSDGRVSLVYHDGLTDRGKLEALISDVAGATKTPGTTRATTPVEVLDGVLSGAIAVFREGETGAVLVPAPATLPLHQPQTERVVRGPHQALTNDLPQNLALIRNLVQRRELRVEYHALGPFTLSKVVIVYVEGEADAAVYDTLLQRLGQARVTTPIDVTMLKPTLADDPWSPFVNVQLTERVDLIATKVLNGGYAVLTSGASQALVLPTTFIEMMASPEDSYLPRYMADFDRFIRYGSSVLALLMEAMYIALTSVNQDLLPTPLAFAIARSRNGVPLPVVGEVVLMALVIEVLKEAAIRLPKILSQTISIVGALVIGQAVVTASLISAPVIVIVAFVALGSFAMPQYELAVAIRLLRFPAMFIAAIFGLYGLALYVLVILAHLCGLRSFGTPYMGPLAPRRKGPMSKLVRVPPAMKRVLT